MNVTDISMLQWNNLRHSQQLESLPKNDRDKLMGACQDFEALFIKQMLDSMKKTVNRTDLFGRNMAEDIFEDMLYDEYAKLMSKSAHLGIAKMLYNQFSQNNTPENQKL